MAGEVEAPQNSTVCREMAGSVGSSVSFSTRFLINLAERLPLQLMGVHCTLIKDHDKVITWDGANVLFVSDRSCPPNLFARKVG